MAAIVAARASGAAAVSTIASFHTHHRAPPSTSRTPLAVASTSSGAARRHHHHAGGACCFAAKPTQVAADLVDPAASAEEEEAKPRKKARSRRSRNKSAAAQLEEGEEGKGEPAAASAAKEEEAAGAEESVRALASLDDVIVNPVGLGRRSRQVFDEVWRKFSRLGQISSASSTALAEEEQAVLIRGGPMCEFTVPGAQDTTVLVVGATSSIGRIVVRKLMLRGYNVKVSKTNFSLSTPVCAPVLVPNVGNSVLTDLIRNSICFHFSSSFVFTVR
jgi:pyruvate/2-oxoglutarate dehydrogenase complex dihydrolipoamide acyltransferase (E2) component